MKRRNFNRLMSAAGIAALSPRVLAAKSKRPNLLIIQTDEHNFRTLGCYRDTLPPDQALMWGDAVVETPHIDRLAKEGAIATKFYCTVPACSPSRGSFFTGLYPQSHDVQTNDIPLKENLVTFAEVLRRAGYSTGYSGKWHLSGEDKPGWDPDNNFGFEDNRYMFNRGHWKKLDFVDGKPVVGMKKGEPSYADIGDETTFTTDWLADRTIDFIEANKQNPFCYVVSIPDPHGPDTVRAPYDTMYAHQKYTEPVSAQKPDESLPSWATKNNPNYEQDKYYGMVKCIDDNVGRISHYLEKNGLFDSTIVIFTADHGDMRGEHGRQNKGVPLEASAKVPFLIRWPGQIKAGSQVDHVLNNVDFLPSILSLMNVPHAVPNNGRDASWMFNGGAEPAGWDDVTVVRGASGRKWLAAMTPRYKLVIGPEDEPWLLDLKVDPNELVNGYANPENKPEVERLTKALADYAEATGETWPWRKWAANN
jgi:arylsulfatase A-like enzyme